MEQSQPQKYVVLGVAKKDAYARDKRTFDLHFKNKVVTLISIGKPYQNSWEGPWYRGVVEVLETGVKGVFHKVKLKKIPSYSPSGSGSKVNVQRL